MRWQIEPLKTQQNECYEKSIMNTKTNIFERTNINAAINH